MARGWKKSLNMPFLSLETELLVEKEAEEGATEMARRNLDTADGNILEDARKACCCFR